MVVAGELFGNYGAALLLCRKDLSPPDVLGSKVLGLQLSQGLKHPRDEGFVLPLLYNVDPGSRPLINC